jgi:hypothetical protein
MEDGVVVFVDAVAEVVRAQELSDVLHRILLRRVGRQRQLVDVVGQAQLAAGPVPASAVEGD